MLLIFQIPFDTIRSITIFNVTKEIEMNKKLVAIALASTFISTLAHAGSPFSGKMETCI